VRGRRHDQTQAVLVFEGSSGAGGSIGAGADAAPLLPLGGHRGHRPQVGVYAGNAPTVGGRSRGRTPVAFGGGLAEGA
jgi:hypothetical protein